MFVKHRRANPDYELVPRDSSDYAGDDYPELPHAASPSWLARLSSALRLRRLSDRAVYVHYVTPRRRRRSVIRLLYWSLFAIPYVLISLVLFAGIFFPSYTVRPDHYNELRQRALQNTQPGRANPHGEKVFITAALYEEKGHLTSGAWGNAVLQLIDLLGPDNVHLSVYEDNPDLKTKQSLMDFRRKVQCESTITFEELDLSSLPRTSLPTGETRLKRIAFLSEVRNRALAPIDTVGVKFDRVLFLNDVIFDPIEAAQLLFATNIDAAGHADYAGACAVDFINPFKFYDRFATRGFDADLTGIPFFPWFTDTESATSRNDVLAQRDAVRVRSCWGGMVAYEAKWFQDQKKIARQAGNDVPIENNLHDVPVRFRYDNESFWESSECCLINADLQYHESGQPLPPNPRIYMNPYIRVAYDESTLSWLSLSRRPERLYSIIHNILNKMVGFPEATNRRDEKPGSTVTDTWWEYDDPARGFAQNATNDDFTGHWIEVQRVAQPGGWCGGLNLLVINETPEHGDGKWSKLWPPHPPA